MPRANRASKVRWSRYRTICQRAVTIHIYQFELPANQGTVRKIGTIVRDLWRYDMPAFGSPGGCASYVMCNQQCFAVNINNRTWVTQQNNAFVPANEWHVSLPYGEPVPRDLKPVEDRCPCGAICHLCSKKRG